MTNPYLIGDRIYLRPVEREDAPVVMPWLNDPEVGRFLRRRPPINRQVEEEFITRVYQSTDLMVLGIVVQATEQFIGVTGFHQIDWRTRQTSFGITIGVKEAWGQGFGTEATALLVRYAFETLNLNRVWLHVYEHNPRAVRCYEKAGFQREGVLRQDTFRDGRYWNTFVMSILREEWDARGRHGSPNRDAGHRG
jgi:RimJ/RimL family protein N-acetyltransferase